MLRLLSSRVGASSLVQCTSSIASRSTVACSPARSIASSAALHSRKKQKSRNSPIATPPAATAATSSSQSSSTPTPPPVHHAPKPVRHDSHTRPSIPHFSDGMLARDFISSSLYHSGGGYFNSSQRVYRSTAPSSMTFTSLKDRTAYYKHLEELYGKYDDCWLTPVEIFKPYYGQAIARWILETRRKELGEESVPHMEKQEEDGRVKEEQQTTEEKKENDSTTTTTSTPTAPIASTSAPHSTSSPSSSTPISSHSSKSPLPALRIMELGGGNGTCSLSILDYLEKHYPALYAQTEYTIVELSEFMIETQKETLKHHAEWHLSPTASGQGGISHTPRVRLLNMSIIDWREFCLDTTYIIGLEVLDNMPHDRVRITKAEGYQQVHVVATKSVPTRDGRSIRCYDERLAPISDRWIGEYGTYWQHFRPITTSIKDALFSPDASIGLWWSEKSTSWKQRMQTDQSVWFPTTALQFLHVIKHYIPRHHLLLADFSHLPATVEGEQGPVVSSKSASSLGKTRDHDTYLVEQGSVDIFFPTDFRQLRYVYERVCKETEHEEAWRMLEEMKGYKNTIVESKDGAAASDATDSSSSEIESPTDSSSSSLSSTSTPSSSSSSLPIIQHPRVLTQYQFMSQYAKPSNPQTSTKSGWNPIMSDYVNFHFFLV